MCSDWAECTHFEIWDDGTTDGYLDTTYDGTCYLYDGCDFAKTGYEGELHAKNDCSNWPTAAPTPAPSTVPTGAPSPVPTFSPTPMPTMIFNCSDVEAH